MTPVIFIVFLFLSCVFAIFFVYPNADRAKQREQRIVAFLFSVITALSGLYMLARNNQLIAGLFVAVVALVLPFGLQMFARTDAERQAAQDDKYAFDVERYKRDLTPRR